MPNVIVVTGGSRGIGAATARLAADRGYDVCVNFLRDSLAAENLVSQIRSAGRHAVAVQANVSVEADIERLFKTVDRELGPVTVLVNNAGTVGDGPRLVENLSSTNLNDLLAVNVFGPFICAREAILRMSTSRGGAGGAIVNVSSAASRHGAPRLWVDYAASKGALDSFTIGLAQELAGEGIRVNAVRPGLIHTEIYSRSGVRGRLEHAERTVPMKRAGRAEEVAESILWLASPAASYVSGAILDVSGAN